MTGATTSRMPLASVRSLEARESDSFAAPSGSGRGVGTFVDVAVRSLAPATAELLRSARRRLRAARRAGWRDCSRTKSLAHERVDLFGRHRAVAIRLLVHERRVAEVRREHRELVGALAG